MKFNAMFQPINIGPMTVKNRFVVPPTLIKDKSMFRPDLVVADVVYNPAETRMVKEAKEAGCKLAIGGKGMLLWQGAESYKLYTGLEMPTDEYQKFQAENENK